MIIKTKLFLNNITDSLSDFIYPPTCIVCNKVMLSANKDKVCVDCWNSIPQISSNHKLYNETKNKIIKMGNIADLASCFVFDKESPLRHIVHSLKYKDYISVGDKIGSFVSQKIIELNLHNNFDAIVPVPLHPIKYRERGYNQAEEIAKQISVYYKKPLILNATQRILNTRTQTKLNIDERRLNMKNAFKVPPQKQPLIAGKNILIVDDVITTGATINFCAKSLKDAGANHIIAASAALAE